jgi:hypothetical protein
LNSVFAQYEELSSPQFAVINLSLRLRLIMENFRLDNSSYRAQPHSIIVKWFFCVGVMYSGEYDACDVTLSVYPHRASLKNMPDHSGNRTYDLWNTTTSEYSPEYITPTQKNHHWLLDYIDIEGTRFCSEISHTRTDLTA